MTLAPIDKNAGSVVSMLEKAKTWLSVAVDMTGPDEIAAAKAQIRTAEVYAHELGLSKEIQDDASEMVRRAEYALGKAIRKGQEEGTVLKRGQMHSKVVGQETVHTKNMGARRPQDFAADHELTGQAGQNNGIYGLVDGVTPDQFETALEIARDEGNLSRANVVRKVKGQQSPATMSRQQRADLIDELAAQGYSSRQMPQKVGVSEETVRQIARDFDITIPADRSIAKTRRVNSAQTVENTATALEGLVMGIELIDYAAVDSATASLWADSLNESMRALNRFVRQIKELTHD